MKANRTIFISGRVDKKTKDYIENHPLSQSDLINYGLYLIRMMESNLVDGKTFITAITVEPKGEEPLPF